MSRRTIRCLWRGIAALVLCVSYSCADSGRAPTSPSPAAQYTPRALSWECMHQTPGSAATGGWSFDAHGVDCGSAPAAVPDSGVGLVSAAPGNLRQTITGTTVRLDWNPLAEAVTSFLIEAGSASTLANLARFNTGNAAPALTVNSVPNGTYFVRVRAIGADGIPGPPSNEIVVQVLDGDSSAPGAPSGFRAQIVGNQVTLSWGASAGAPAASYIVEAGSGPGLSNIVVFDTGSGATQLSATAPNGTYYVRLRARNGLGTGPASNEIVVVTPGGGPPTSGGPCNYSVTPTSAALLANGGPFDIAVTTTVGCSWTVSPGTATFATLQSSASAIGPGVARFNVQANGTTSERRGVARVSWDGGGQDVALIQIFTPSQPPTAQVPPVESVITVPPQPAVETSTLVPTPPPPPLPNAGGCTNCRPTTGNTSVSNGSTPGTVTFHIESGNREAFDELILALSGLTPVTAPGFEFAPDGSSSHYVVRLTSPRTSADIALNVVTSQSFSAQVAVAVNSQLPTNYVTTQPIAPAPPTPCAFTVNGPTALLSSGAGTFDVSVTSSSAGCSWTASSGSAFISVVTGSGSTPGVARFSIAANTGSASRSGTVTVAGRFITITQAAGPSCQQLVGTWEQFLYNDRPATDTIRLQITSVEPNCSFSGTFNGAVRHSLSGVIGGAFQMVRIDPAGCTNLMAGILTSANPNEIRWQIQGTSGTCGVPAGFRESRTFRRIN